MESEPSWVIERLERWGQWSRLSIAGARGYPSEAAFVPHAKGRAFEFCSPEVEQTEQAVAGLPEELRAVVVAKYVHEGSVGTKTKRLHLCRATFWRRLQWAYRVLAVRLALGGCT